MISPTERQLSHNTRELYELYADIQTNIADLANAVKSTVTKLSFLPELREIVRRINELAESTKLEHGLTVDEINGLKEGIEQIKNDLKNHSFYARINLNRWHLYSFWPEKEEAQQTETANKDELSESFAPKK